MPKKVSARDLDRANRKQQQKIEQAYNEEFREFGEYIVRNLFKDELYDTSVPEQIAFMKNLKKLYDASKDTKPTVETEVHTNLVSATEVPTQAEMPVASVVSEIDETEEFLSEDADAE